MKEEKILALQNLFGCLLFAGITISCFVENGIILIISICIAFIGYVGARVCEAMLNRKEKND